MNELRGLLDAVDDDDPADEGRGRPQQDEREERTAASPGPLSPEPP
ncbi:hypothetical protein [Streptomyces sp. NRRL B-3229]|nr:hypothetical protein [Streptomyces sp. NRRL B-3229]